MPDSTSSFDEVREPRAIKMKPSVLRKAHIRAIELEKTVGHWVEEAIEEKLAREDSEKQPK